MEMKESVFAVIPVWNSGEQLKRCLHSLLDLEYEPIRIIVADNRSTDDTEFIVRGFKERFERRNLPLEYVKFDKNYGHPGAMNKVLRMHYRGEHYLLKIDSDVEIDDREVLDKMISFLENHPEIGIIGPRMKVPGVKENIVATYWIKNLGTLKQREESRPVEVDLVNGGFLLMRAKLYRKLKYLGSEVLFYGWIELDLCERARALGYKTYFYPDTTVIHKLVTLRSKNERQIYYDLRNLLLVNWKYGTPLSKLTNFILLFWPRIAFWFVARSHFNPLPILGAVRDFLMLRKAYERESSIERD